MKYNLFTDRLNIIPLDLISFWASGRVDDVVDVSSIASIISPSFNPHLSAVPFSVLCKDELYILHTK